MSARWRTRWVELMEAALTEVELPPAAVPRGALLHHQTSAERKAPGPNVPTPDPSVALERAGCRPSPANGYIFYPRTSV